VREPKTAQLPHGHTSHEGLIESSGGLN